MPVRLAGTLPWVSRLHVAVLCAVGTVGVLFAVAPVIDESDLGTTLTMAVAGTVFAVIAGVLIAHTRRSFSALVTPLGVFTVPAASGVWLADVVLGDATAARVQTVTAIRVIAVRRDYDLIGGDVDLSVPVRRLALVVEGVGTPNLAGLTFSANRNGRRRAETAGQFLSRCFDVKFHTHA